MNGVKEMAMALLRRFGGAIAAGAAAAGFAVPAEAAWVVTEIPTPPEWIGHTEALEIFLTQAGLAFEKAILERRIREMSKRA